VVVRRPRVRLAVVASAVGMIAGCVAVTDGRGASLHTSASRTASPLPRGWTKVARGLNGGSVFAGRIPNPFAYDRRRSAIYVPAGYSRTRRYPVVYLLHGLPGSPSSLYDALKLAKVADKLTADGLTSPFVAVMPVGGPIRHPARGEWVGSWESFVVDAVVPWVDAHLSTVATRRGRAIAGVCAGGYGAMNIGLRHPRVFGTLESWGGYFAPVFRDGPFAHASRLVLDANDPTLLVRREVPLLRRLRTHFYVSVGGNHAQVRRRWTLEYAALLGRLTLSHRLWLLPRSERGNFWRATLPSALVYAGANFDVKR